MNAQLGVLKQASGNHRHAAVGRSQPLLDELHARERKGFGTEARISSEISCDGPVDLGGMGSAYCAGELHLRRGPADRRLARETNLR